MSHKLMRVGLLGGSFNPITKAHVNIAKAALEYLGPGSQVWFSPCYISLYRKSLASPTHRLKMCQVAIDQLAESQPSVAERLHVCPFEIENQLTGETADALPVFLSQYHAVNPDYRFYFIIGFDNAIKIKTWGRWQEVIEMMPFLVFPRDVDDIVDNTDTDDNAWYLNTPHIYARDHRIDPISSTRVRQELLETGISNLIHSEVLNYVKAHGLYDLKK